MEERIIALEARFDEHCRQSKEIIDSQLSIQQEWLKWRHKVDTHLENHNTSLMSLAEGIYELKHVEVINGKSEIKPIQIAIGEIWEATAFFRILNKIVTLINKRKITKTLFRFANIVIVSAILYAVFGYAVFGVPLISIIKGWLK